MSTNQTKIFGMTVGFDPKLVVLALIVIAGVVYYFTSDSGTSSGSSQASTQANVARPPMSQAPATRAATARRTNVLQNDRGTLKVVPVNGASGDVDPTLRLALLDRVKNIPPAAGLRNLFESSGNQMVVANLPPVPKNPPKLPPGPLTPPPGPTAFIPPPPPPFTIPLKYYGFVKPSGRPLDGRVVDGNRGFFMDGDNILIGAEGDVLERRFLIVALTPNTARLEDTQVKQGQELQVLPAAQ